MPSYSELLDAFHGSYRRYNKAQDSGDAGKVSRAKQRLTNIADQIEAAAKNEGIKLPEGIKGSTTAGVKQAGLDKQAKSMAVDQVAEEYHQAAARAKTPEQRAKVEDISAGYAKKAAKENVNNNFDYQYSDSLGGMKSAQGKIDQNTVMANRMKGLDNKRTGGFQGRELSPETIANMAESHAQMFRSGKGGGPWGSGAMSAAMATGEPLITEIDKDPREAKIKQIDQQYSVLGGPRSSEELSRMISDIAPKADPMRDIFSPERFKKPAAKESAFEPGSDPEDYNGQIDDRGPSSMKKKPAKAGRDTYMPIPDAPAPIPDDSAIESAMGYAFPKEERYPVTSKYQKTGSYAPYSNNAASGEEQKKIQDELLNEEVKHMTRDPSGMGKATQNPVDAVMGQSFQQAPSYQQAPAYQGQTQYPEDSYDSHPHYVNPSQSGYGKVPARMNGAPKTYFDAPFKNTPTNMEPGHYTPSHSPYQLHPGVSTPLKTTPMENQAMEEAIRKALQNSAQEGADMGNSIKIQR